MDTVAAAHKPVASPAAIFGWRRLRVVLVACVSVSALALISWTGSYHVLLGKEVPQNNVKEFDVGFYARGVESRNLRFTYGINVTTLGYKRNLRRFTLGHGGYFSPKNYFSASLPMQLEGFRNRLSYKPVQMQPLTVESVPLKVRTF